MSAVCRHPHSTLLRTHHHAMTHSSRPFTHNAHYYLGDCRIVHGKSETHSCMAVESHPIYVDCLTLLPALIDYYTISLHLLVHCCTHSINMYFCSKRTHSNQKALILFRSNRSRNQRHQQPVAEAHSHFYKHKNKPLQTAYTTKASY